MKKGQVKTYVLNSNGEYELLTDDTEYVEEENIDYEKLPENIKEMLHTNPFLLEENKITKQYIKSIEEFYIIYNNEEITLDSIIRNDIYDKKTKIKILKKQFKSWKTEANQYIKKTVLERKQNLLSTSSNKLKILSPLNKFLLFIGIVLAVLVLGNVFSFFKYKTIETIASVLIIIANLGCFVLIYIQSTKIKEYKAKLKIFNNKHQYIYKKILSNLKIKYNKLKKYYLDGYQNNMFVKEAYEFKNINIEIKEINSLVQLHNEIIRNYTLIGNYKKINIYYHIPKLITYLSFTLLTGYILVMFVISIYNKIF